MSRFGKYELTGFVLQFLICFWIAVAPDPPLKAEDGARVAVLENRADQIDMHLRSTDDSVQRLWTELQNQRSMIESQNTEIAKMQGEGAGIGIALSALSGLNLLAVYRKGRGGNGNGK